MTANAHVTYSKYVVANNWERRESTLQPRGKSLSWLGEKLNFALAMTERQKQPPLWARSLGKHEQEKKYTYYPSNLAKKKKIT